jgi:uncharacterized protein (TIGR02466 family)
MAKIDIFSTPIYKFKVIQNTIDEAIVESKQLEKLEQYKEWKCNVDTTYHLKPEAGKLNNSLEECLFPFVFDYVSNIINNRTLTMQINGFWLNRYKENSFQERHSHAGNSNIISFIYMYKTSENHSALRFHNPFDITLENVKGYSSLEFSHERYDFLLKEREVLLFPSYLHHSVHPVHPQGERITLSGNINIT